MKRLVSLVIVLIVGLLVWSCSSTKYASVGGPNTGANTESVSNPQPSSSTLKYPKVNTINQTNMSVSEIEKAFSKIATDIHFKFNSYKLQPIDEYGINEDPTRILDRIAAFLREHPDIRIRIEGNCDERGTIEYNLALGEKRALAAKNYLVSKGIDPSRIEIISYGKSRPLDPAHNEYAWAKNRRDHFVIIK